MTAVLDLPAPQVAVPPADPTAISTRQRWLGLFAVLAALILNLLDSTVVNVAGPAIRAELGGTYASLQWIAAGYPLALAVGLLTGGRLGDMYGRRRMLLIGVVGFVVASMACAAAPGPQLLIGARVLQGLSAALLIPQAFGLVRDLFPAPEIGKAFAAFGPVIGLATILGPIVAGLLIDADLLGTGWRAIFGINLPLGAFALVAGWKALPAGAPAVPHSRLDVIGALLGGTGMFLLVYPLVQGRELGWPTWSLAMLAASVPVLAGFAVYQLRRGRSGATPLVELGVFARRSYSAGVVFVIVFFGAVVGCTLAVGLVLQIGLGYSPMRASLAMAALAIGAFLGSAVGGALTHKLGRRILHLGLGLMTGGTVGLYAVLVRSNNAFGTWDLAVPLVVFGAGMGMIFVPLFDIIMGGVADREVGSAAAILESLQQLGASLGVAVLSTVFFGVIGASAQYNFDASAAPALRVELAAAGVPGTEQDRIVAAARACIRDRENATDPDIVPASCRAGGPETGAVAGAVRAAATETHVRGALDGAERTTLITLGLIAAAFGLGFLLPAKARQHLDHQS